MLTKSRTRIRRLTALSGAALATALATAAGTQAAAPAAQASVTGAPVTHRHSPIPIGDIVVVTVPGAGVSYLGGQVSLQVKASSIKGYPIIRYGAGGLPTGLQINSTTGLITGFPKTVGCFHTTVSATDSHLTQGWDKFTWLVRTPGPHEVCPPWPTSHRPGQL
jgi:hypothetical protein